MTTHFHTHAGLGTAMIPRLEVKHAVRGRVCSSGYYVEVTLQLGHDDLTIFAELPEAQEIASAFCKAAGALAAALDGKAVSA